MKTISKWLLATAFTIIFFVVLLMLFTKLTYDEDLSELETCLDASCS